MEQEKVLITIDEAQRVLGAGGSSTQIFRECAMEGRKFGIGLCVVTQQPKNIDQKVLAQINTFVVMGLGDKGNSDIIMGSANQDLSKMEIEIQRHDQGEDIISTIGSRFPLAPVFTTTRIISQASSGSRKRISGTGLKPGSDTRILSEEI